MSRIPLVESEHASPEVRAVYNQLEGWGMSVLNVMKLFANDANFLAGFAQIFQPLYGNTPQLAPRYRELAYLRAAQLNSCHY